MKSKQATRYCAAGAAAALLALPTWAVVESYDERAAFRTEVMTLAATAPQPPVMFLNPHDEGPRPGNIQHDDPSMRFELRERRNDPLEPLWFERDGRPNDNGEPRLKDLINPDRRR
jgi:hypothetical protein